MAHCLSPEVSAPGKTRSKAMRKLRRRVKGEIDKAKYFKDITQEYVDAQELCGDVVKFINNNPECSTSEVVKNFAADEEDAEMVGKVLASLAFLTREGIIGATEDDDE